MSNGKELYLRRRCEELEAQLITEKAVISKYAPLGLIKCASCGKWTPVTEEGIDHICDACLLASEKAASEKVAVEVTRLHECIKQGDEHRHRNYSAMKQRAEAAEQRIRDSQEQEPVGYAVYGINARGEIYLHDLRKIKPDCLSDDAGCDDYWDGNALVYKQPIIPPEVEELKRKIKYLEMDKVSLNDTALSYLEERTEAFHKIEELKLSLDKTAEDYLAVVRENAELTRKLAELQAIIFNMNHPSNLGNLLWVECSKKLREADMSELNKLLSERSVPEGWKLVPVKATRDMEKAGSSITYSSELGISRTLEEISEIYKAMLSASPQPKEQT